MAKDIITQADFRRLERQLMRLGDSISTTRKRNAMKKGLKPFINAAITNAPKDTGDLALSIDTKTFRNNKDYVFAGPVLKKRVNLGKNLGTETVDPFYAHWIEYGHRVIAWPSKGETIRSGKVVPQRITHIAPRPFIRNSWRQSSGAVVRETTKAVTSIVKREAKKLER